MSAEGMAVISFVSRSVVMVQYFCLPTRRRQRRATDSRGTSRTGERRDVDGVRGTITA